MLELYFLKNPLVSIFVLATVVLSSSLIFAGIVGNIQSSMKEKRDKKIQDTIKERIPSC